MSSRPVASEGELSRQALPRRPRDWDDEPAELEPAPERATSPGRPSALSSRGAAAAAQLEDDDGAVAAAPVILNEYRYGVTRADLWIAVFASSALAVVVTAVLHAVGLYR